MKTSLNILSEAVVARAPQIEAKLIFSIDHGDNKQLHATLLKVVNAAWAKATGSRRKFEDTNDIDLFATDELRFDVYDAVDFSVRFELAGDGGMDTDLITSAKDIEVRIGSYVVLPTGGRAYVDKVYPNMGEGELERILVEHARKVFKSPDCTQAMNNAKNFVTFMTKARA